jgi:hypothetical protein
MTADVYERSMVIEIHREDSLIAKWTWQAELNSFSSFNEQVELRVKETHEKFFSKGNAERGCQLR